MPEHPSEDLLSSYALDPSLVEDAAELEAHLAGCFSCRQQVAGMRSFEEVVGNRESWSRSKDAAPVTAPAYLSATAARSRREDAEAEAMLKPLLERFLSQTSGKFLWLDIAAKPEYHTAGVVRKLTDAADTAQYSDPRRALILAETASTIVEKLSKASYTTSEIAALRGVSWKQQANANRQLGRFHDAFDALAVAERAFREVRRPELDLASITFIRASIYAEQQMYELAEQHAQASAKVFSQLGQRELYVRSRQLQGYIAFGQRKLGKAQVMFDSVLEYAETEGDAFWIAAASIALGNCYLERDELSSATQYLEKAMLGFRNLGMVVEEIRCRWGLALVVQREGRYSTAIERLDAVRKAFLSREATSDAALVTLDIMETFLLLGKTREVRRTAGHIEKLFKDAGMVTGALTAADYLKQAAAKDRVTLSLLAYIRNYFRRVAIEPDLIFVPPSAL